MVGPSGPERRFGAANECAVLAGLNGALALTALAFVLVAPVVSAQAGVDLVVVVVSAATAVLTLVLRPGSGRSAEHTALLVFSVMAALLVWARATPQGQATAAYVLSLGMLFAAVYLPHRQMLAHVAVMSALFTAAVLLSPVGLDPFYLAVRVVSMLVVAEVVSRLVQRQVELVDAISEQALHDPLTGALNRRGGEAAADHVRGVVERGGGTVTVTILDLDGFKGFNDEHGHAAGDALLVEIVSTWLAHLRAGDVLARVGGDEFLLVLPQTDAAAATHLVARMRAAHPYPWTSGTTEWQPHEGLFDAAARADASLYDGKLRRHFHTTPPPATDVG